MPQFGRSRTVKIRYRQTEKHGTALHRGHAVLRTVNNLSPDKTLDQTAAFQSSQTVKPPYPAAMPHRHAVRFALNADSESEGSCADDSCIVAELCYHYLCFLRAVSCVLLSFNLFVYEVDKIISLV